MRFATSLVIAILLTATAFGSGFDRFVKEAALKNGFQKPDAVNPPTNSALASVGKVFFQSKFLSLNENISCQTCHLDEFGSGDGIPNAVGVGGDGEGPKRLAGGGAIIPRNTLPLWGRGAREVETLFWDGKVDFSSGQSISQFGDKPPSQDPLIVAVHLPAIEIREMLIEDNLVERAKREDVEAAGEIYQRITARLKTHHPQEFSQLATVSGKTPEQVGFVDVASSIAEFIRQKFAIKETKFSRFIFEQGELDDAELAGALLFYGKGKCAVCHGGTLFSDFEFHAVPFIQIGQGKNGFGIDYGRFNVTHDPGDLYKFRTPPLLNVANTGPFGHSGSAVTLEDAVTQHFDPLRNLPIAEMDTLERTEFYRRMATSGASAEIIPTLSDAQVSEIVSFLKTLSFDQSAAN